MNAPKGYREIVIMVPMSVMVRDDRHDVVAAYEPPSLETVQRGLDVSRDMIHSIAQGVINITEGLTTIEAGSRVHRAMQAFCDLLSPG